MGLHTITATLDVTDAELEIIGETARAAGLREAEFLGRCLARGLLVVVQEHHDARTRRSDGSLPDQPVIEDDLPF